MKLFFLQFFLQVFHSRGRHICSCRRLHKVLPETKSLKRHFGMRSKLQLNERYGLPSEVIAFNNWLGTLPHRYKVKPKVFEASAVT